MARKLLILASREPIPDRLLDQLFSGPYAQPPHSVLYHYTTWKGAAGILSSQRFWATAHNCTNDEAELTSADDIIVEVASQLRGDVPNCAASLLDRFISDYRGTRISEVVQIYLTCFTLDQRGHLNRMLRFWAQLECATAFSPSLAILEKVRAIR